MQDLNSNSTPDLEQSISSNGSLQVVEYVVAAGAVAGTVATFLVNQAAIVAVPLTASVFLNLINRRHWDQLTHERTFSDTTEVQRRLTAEIQSLRSQVEDLPAFQERSDYNDVKVSITSLSASVSTLEQQMMNVPAGDQPLEAISAIEAEINQLREYQIDLTHSIEALQGQISSDAEGVNFPDSIHQELTALQEAVAQLSPPTAEGSSGDISSLKDELQSMLSPVQQQVTDLSNRLEHQGATATSPPEEQLASVYGQIDDVRVKMDTMLANISEEMEISRAAMENTQQQVNEVQHQLGVVREEATNTTGVNTEDFHQQLQTAIGPLQDQIGELENRISTLPTLDPAMTQGQEEQLQGLQHHLQDLSNRLETVSTQFSTEMANLPNMVDEQVQSRVSAIQAQTVPPGDESAKQDKLSELDSLLADLS
ncbi:hypothetical protein [Acaryochloris sp. IP29b_bin.148]|uniref:hypothetical protein n=1 Tax=Acaryochloris sp. IP29b_bin.148 TaxID=2969218 RepID=UPI0026079E16|nr:hypothetical protein [Acaryochloris sp. IP29b_bin.148]